MSPRMHRRTWIGWLACWLLLANAARAAEPAWDFVRWQPIAENPVFAGAGGDAWDRKIRERGSILLGKDGYHLWYTGYNDSRSPLRLLGHATSADGIHWQRDPANPIFRGSWTEDMHVSRDGSQLRMVAEGEHDIAHQLLSTDGRHWADLGSLDIRTTAGSPLSPGPYGTPVLWHEGKTDFLFYERGDQGVWLATATDGGRVWTNVQDEPVIATGPAAYDRTAVALNQVVKRGEFYYGFYHANATRPWKDWTTCVARSRDLIHWDKYPGNPVIAGNCSSAMLVETPEGDRLYTMHPDVKLFRPAPQP